MGLAAAVGVGAAASIGGALISSNASENAASQQVAAEQAAQQTQLQMYNQTRKDLSPFRTTGQSALDSIANMYGLANGGTGVSANQSTANFENTPNYQFAFQQGQQAVNSAAAAQGQVLSGANQKALATFGSGLASQQFGNYMSQLLSLANIGQSSAAQQANANQSAANSVSGLQTAQGASQAAGTIGSANALSGGMSSIGSLGLYSMLGNNMSSYGANSALMSGAGGLGSGNGFSLIPGGI